MEFPWHSGEVLEQLNRQRKQGLLCDCTFVVDGVDFKAHKAVLAACSVYFRTLFLDQKDVVHLDISNAAGRIRLWCRNFLTILEATTAAYTSSVPNQILYFSVFFSFCRFGSCPGLHVHLQTVLKSQQYWGRAVCCPLPADAGNHKCLFCVSVDVKSTSIHHNSGSSWWSTRSLSIRLFVCVEKLRIIRLRLHNMSCKANAEY